MRLTDAQIANYQKIYLDIFGEEISKEDALVQGMALLRLVKVLSKSSDKSKEYDNEKLPRTIS
jgi:hypothetical protein